LNAPGRYAFLAALLLILATTFPPTGLELPETSFWPENLAADFARNIALYMPLGLALAMRRVTLRRLICAAFLLSLLIELLQIFIPGRDSSVLDIAANTVGTAAGASLWLGRQAPRRAPRWAGAAAELALLGLFAVTGWMIQPDLPVERAYRGDWMPTLQERYKGGVLGATIGADSLRPWRAWDQVLLRPRLMGNVDLAVLVVVGPPPRRRSVLVRLYDEAQRDIMDLEIERDDLAWRLRSRSVALRFEQPVVRWPHAMAGLEPGDTTLLQLRRLGPRTCATIQGIEHCNALRAAEAWTLAVPAERVPALLRPMVGWLWLALIVLPAGLLSSSRQAALFAVPMLALVLVAGPLLTGLAPLQPADWIAAAAGVAAGLASSGLVPLRRLSGRSS
jgi:hypothetical protein